MTPMQIAARLAITAFFIGLTTMLVYGTVSDVNGDLHRVNKWTVRMIIASTWIAGVMLFVAGVLAIWFARPV